MVCFQSLSHSTHQRLSHLTDWVALNHVGSLQEDSVGVGHNTTYNVQ